MSEIDIDDNVINENLMWAYAVDVVSSKCI